MNAEIPTPDLAECERFAAMWCHLTAAPHITLTAIKPDGPTDTLTFARGTGEQLRDWIARKQGQGDNVYFEVNEAPGSCRTKPTKASMVAAVCRHADIDPMDEAYPFADERARLHGLAELLTSDTEMPPSVIIDSGNGIQPLWVIAREPLTPEVVERVEAENRAVEAALGAIGTHNIDRLLRLPGTVNFPNQKKRKRGRGACQARLLHSALVTYTPNQAAGLGTHLQSLVYGSALVRSTTTKAKRKAQQSIATDAPELSDLLLRIEAATARWPTLARRWGGDWTDLKDASDSAKAMSLAGLLRRAGFDFNEMTTALVHHSDTAEWTKRKGCADGSREVRRVWDAGAEPAPSAEPQWPILDISIATADTLPAPDLPLHDVFPARWAAWIVRAAEAKGAPTGYVATALLSFSGSLIGNARWVQPWEEWAEPPVVNAALIGPPSAGKSPSLDALVEPTTKIEAENNDDWQERRSDHARDDLAAKLKRESWQDDVRTAVKMGNPPPTMPAEAAEPAPPQRRRILSTDPTVAKAERMSAANPRGLLMLRDELAGWLAGLDRYSGGGDRQFWLQANGGRPWTPDRVKDGDNEISVPNLLWGIVGGIQPDRLASLLLAGDDDGMAARFIYCWPDPVPPRRPPLGQGLAEAREWLKRLRTLPWTPPAPLLVPFSAAAQTIMQEWREAAAAMEVGASGLFLSWVGKLPGFAARLALIFAHLAWCADGRGEPPGEVTEADILRAVTFLSNYAVPMARRAFGEAALPQAERDSRRLARWLLRQKPRPGTLNARELRRMADGPGIPDAARMDAALHELAELGLVREAASNRTGGRPRSDWRVHPDIVAADGMA